MATTNSSTFTTIRIDHILDALVDAYDTASLKTSNDPRWHAAVLAGFNALLEADTVEYCAATHALRLESLSRPGRFYEANGVCQCEAAAHGQPCLHRAAARLVRRALELQDAADLVDDAATAASEGPITLAPDLDTERRALAGELYDELLNNDRDLDSFAAQDIADLQAAALLTDVLVYAQQWDTAASVARAARPMVLAA